MFNYYDYVREHPEEYKQFSCKELLFLICECPPDFKKSEDWAEHNCFIYILSGKVIVHSRDRCWNLKQGDTIFLKKGGCAVEKTEYDSFCSLMFYVPDTYLRSFTRENTVQFSAFDLSKISGDLVLSVETNPVMTAFYDSVVSYFISDAYPPEDLLELKFRELLLNTIINPANQELKAYLYKLSIIGKDDLRDVMERNYRYDLQLNEFARLCHRSLSSFKRDFYSAYGTPPGRWLLERRLEAAHHLVLTSDKPIGDVAAESGFENNTHFSRVLKSHYGVSPLQCRRQVTALTDHYS
ncbi:MAG TPA: AraC family transcriptional regulator [Chitinophagaceae bacterium]|nr:AraC family transcriptional regulator [Chitinophagaceae bacterium]